MTAPTSPSRRSAPVRRAFASTPTAATASMPPTPLTSTWLRALTVDVTPLQRHRRSTARRAQHADDHAHRHQRHADVSSADVSAAVTEDQRPALTTSGTLTDAATVDNLNSATSQPIRSALGGSYGRRQLRRQLPTRHGAWTFSVANWRRAVTQHRLTRDRDLQRHQHRRHGAARRDDHDDRHQRCTRRGSGQCHRRRHRSARRRPAT